MFLVLAFFWGGVPDQSPLLARGGGGCFVAGTPVTLANGRRVAIEKINVGDRVRAVTPEGRVVHAEVRRVFRFEGRSVFRLTTENGLSVEATGEHPIGLGAGKFRNVADLFAGIPVVTVTPFLGTANVREMRPRPGIHTVFNLEVDSPHTFIAGGLLVHNKGGGGGGGGGGGSRSYRSSRSRGSGSQVSWFEVIFLWVIILFFKLLAWFQVPASGVGGKGAIDKILPLSALDAKSKTTRRLIDDIARQDSDFTNDRIEAVAREAFLTLQAAWTTRQYERMAPLVFPDLARDHERQLASMRRNRETNRIENITVERIEPVQINYTAAQAQRSFTVVVQAKMSDYYVNDQSGALIRGDRHPERFQEFWTFQWYQDSYRLREIEQVGDSTALLTSNRVEGQAGGSRHLESPPLGKLPSHGKVDRLVDAFAESNPIWDQKTMRERARAAAIAIYTAYETGETEALDDLAEPAFLDGFVVSLQATAQSGEQREFRNLCVRKVVIVLARPANHQHPDEFHARVELHAQRVTRRGESVIQEDPDLTTFETVLLFQRTDDQFLLTKILKSA